MDKNCPDCKMEFSRKDVMLRHRRNKHSSRNEPDPQSSDAYPPPPPPPPHTIEAPPPPPPHAIEAPPPLPPQSSEDQFIFKHPFTGIISGPTSCGKTFLVQKILQQQMVKPSPQRIIWIYRRWQPIYDEIKRSVWPPVQFIQGIPIDIDKDSYLNSSVRNFIILDDVMASSSKDGRITELFTEGSHHRNLSVLAINQNLYFSKDPTQRRNCQYLILFNNPIDQQQIITLARQMYPGKSKHFMDKFYDATSHPYGYLLVDLKPTTQENMRLRANVIDPIKEDDVISRETNIRLPQAERIPHYQEDISSEQTYENMPSCDDCGVVLDSMHDLQRHIKSWCPENDSLKRKRDQTDDSDVDTKKTKWIEYESQSENDDTDDDNEETVDDNEGYKKLLNDAIDTTQTTWDKKYEKYIKDGFDKKEACDQSNEEITSLVQREFYKRYSAYLKLAIHLDKNDVHNEIVQKIQSLVNDEDDDNVVINRVLRKNRRNFEDLFNDDYFEINDDRDTDDDSDSEHDE